MMVSVFSGYGQTDTALRYFSATMQTVQKNSAIYTAKIFQGEAGWNAILVNNAGDKVLTGTFKEKSLNTKNGYFIYYYPGGAKQMEGRMENNLQEGWWKGWYASGKIKDSVFFNRGAKNGGSFAWFENGLQKFTGAYKNNEPSGDWNWFHENGNPSTKEKYVNQKIVSLECFDSTGKYSGFQCGLETTPSIIGMYGGIHKFIVDSLLYPADAFKRGIEGTVNLEFTITRNGSMENLQIISSPDKLLSDEVIRIILRVPGWYPALEHNRPIDYRMKLNIPFYRNQEDN